MASKQADSLGGPAMKKPRVEAASWSYIDDQPNIQYDHAVSIGNFSRKMKMPSGKFLSSGIFSFIIKNKQSKWSILCYPNGCAEREGFVSIYLAPEDSNQLPIKTEFILSIINKDGAKSVSEKFFCTFDDYNGEGEHKFFSHETLQNNDLNLLPDDVLTIHCAITVLQEDETVVTSGTNRPLLSQEAKGYMEEDVPVLKCVKDSYINGLFSDCVIVCQGREFNCHKMILGGMSPVFNATFTHGGE